MSELEPRLRALFAATQLESDALEYTLVKLPLSKRGTVLAALAEYGGDEYSGEPLAIMVEPQEVSVLLASAMWRRLAASYEFEQQGQEEGWRRLTLRVTVPLDVFGYLAPLASLLAAAGVPLYVVSAYSTDHIFVQQAHYETASRVLRDFFAACAR